MSDVAPRSHALAARETAGAFSAYLSAHGVQHEIVEHDAAFTATSEARAAAVAPDQAAKTVVMQDRGGYLLVLVPASERLDLHKLREVLGASKSLRLATEEEIGAHFAQFELGAVPPVGDVAFVGEIVDRRLVALERMLCSSGDHRHSVIVNPADVVRLAGARVADICED